MTQHAERARLGAHPSRARRSVRAGWAVLLAAAVTAGAAGCGIRGTSVPVDAGAAPVRVSCEAPEDRSTPGPHTRRSVRADVYLVCSAQLRAVHRTVPAAPDPQGTGRLQAARTLLEELQRHPASEEAAAGFGTEVPDGLTVRAGRADDPAGALRLSRPPGELPSYALAQVVCTLAMAEVGKDRQSVLLGGPGAAGIERYVCDQRLRDNPESAADAGVPVG